jgi:hypothetical protein
MFFGLFCSYDVWISTILIVTWRQKKCDSADIEISKSDSTVSIFISEIQIWKRSFGLFSSYDVWISTVLIATWRQKKCDSVDMKISKSDSTKTIYVRNTDLKTFDMWAFESSMVLWMYQTDDMNNSRKRKTTKYCGSRTERVFDEQMERLFFHLHCHIKNGGAGFRWLFHCWHRYSINGKILMKSFISDFLTCFTI